MGCSGDGGDSGTVDGGSLCDSETRATPYETGMVLQTDDGAWTIQFVRADPTPPEKGDNRWTLGLADATGTAVTDALLSVEPTMPDHGHGTNPSEFEATWDDGAGGYLIDDLYLTMAGYWEFTFHVSADGAAQSQATLGLCLES